MDAIQFNDAVQEKMFELIPTRMRKNNFEQLNEAIGNDDNVMKFVYALIFGECEDMTDVHELQASVQKSLIDYLGPKFETECQQLVQSDIDGENAYRKELADDARRDQYREDFDFQWRTA